MDTKNKPPSVSGVPATTKSSGRGLINRGGLGKALAEVGQRTTSVKPTAGTHIAEPQRADRRVLDKVRGGCHKGRICFLIDATASRSDTWIKAQKIQAGMFVNVSRMGSMELGVVCHRGDRVEHLGWFRDGGEAKAKMSRVTCVTGNTCIAESLEAALRCDDGRFPSSIIMIGDCCEEDAAVVRRAAEKVAAAGTKVFSFLDTLDHHDEDGEYIYRMVAHITGGSFAEFGADMPLQDLCEAVAIMDVGGQEAFERLLRAGNKAAQALKAGTPKMPGHVPGAFLSGPGGRG